MEAIVQYLQYSVSSCVITLVVLNRPTNVFLSLIECRFVNSYSILTYNIVNPEKNSYMEDFLFICMTVHKNNVLGCLDSQLQTVANFISLPFHLAGRIG